MIPTAHTQHYSKRYLELLKDTHAHFFFTRNPQGELTHTDPNVSAALGYSAENFQINWEKYLTDNIINHENLRRFKSPTISDDHNRYEFEFIHQQGRCIWMEIIEECSFDDQKQVLCLNNIAWDISRQKDLELEIKLREDRFREISECTPIGIFQIDPDDLFVYVNTRWQAITGQSLKNTLGIPWWQIIHPLDQERVFQVWTQAEKEGHELTDECRIIRPDGGVRWVRLRTRFFFYDRGKVTVGTIEDITENRMTADRLKQYSIDLEQKNKEKDTLILELEFLKNQLEISAKTDPLTGLLNRRGMGENIEQELFRYERSKKPPTFIITDIDHFKSINDTYGHDVGDHILVEVAKELKKMLRKQDMICRWGGEEFLILLPETDLNGAQLLAEKCRLQIEKQVYIYKKNTVRVTLSFGVSIYNKSDKTEDPCIKRADECLYLAKNSGRNKVVCQSQSNLG